MERVTGIGGIFFKARDPEKLSAWYEEHLGICLGWEAGALFKWEERGGIIWSHRPSTPSPMIHFRVTNLERMLEQLHAAGVQIDPEIEESGFGKLGWCIDPEGHRVELWEPPPTSPGPRRLRSQPRTHCSGPDLRLTAHAPRGEASGTTSHVRDPPPRTLLGPAAGRDAVLATRSARRAGG